MKKFAFRLGFVYTTVTIGFVWCTNVVINERERRREIEAWKRQRLAEIAAERKDKGL